MGRVWWVGECSGLKCVGWERVVGRESVVGGESGGWEECSEWAEVCLVGESGGWVHVGTVCMYVLCECVGSSECVCVCLACTSVFHGLLPVSTAPSVLPCSTLRKSWDQLKSG